MAYRMDYSAATPAGLKALGGVCRRCERRRFLQIISAVSATGLAAVLTGCGTGTAATRPARFRQGGGNRGGEKSGGGGGPGAAGSR